MPQISIPSYFNGFQVEQINCIDIPIASSAGFYNYDNYYFAAFYSWLYKNYPYNIPADFPDSKNFFLKKLGLSLQKNIITDNEEMFNLIKNKLEHKIPLLVMAKYKYMFFATQYKDEKYNSAHLLLISEYNPERSLMALSEFIHNRRFSYPNTKGEIISRLPLTTEEFAKIVNSSNKDFKEIFPEYYQVFFTMEKTGEPEINTARDVIKDWLDNYSGGESLFIDYIKKIQTKEIPFNQKSAVRTFLMPYRNLFEIMSMAYDRDKKDANFREKLWSAHCGIFDVRKNIIAEITEKHEKKMDLNEENTDKIIKKAKQADQEFIDFALKIYQDRNKKNKSTAGHKKNNLINDAIIKASSESKPLFFIANDDDTYWASHWADREHWISFSFKNECNIVKIEIRHHGDWELNTRDFEILGSRDGQKWNLLDAVKGNCKNKTVHLIESDPVKHLKIMITQPSLNDFIARISYINIDGDFIVQ